MGGSKQVDIQITYGYNSPLNQMGTIQATTVLNSAGTISLECTNVSAVATAMIDGMLSIIKVGALH